ncbi:hypothetical protein VTK73DRAFT_2048 [Phialemonium thermophilum]|uniref:Uncharacterized protein n=1 Tax=Phialemonium thermophilum TaxID=223376 RepID=A0ABR3VSQ8_9PEZI
MSVPLHLRSQVLEALLFLAEDGLLEVRNEAAELAPTLTTRRTPAYLRASIRLCRSTISRLHGDLERSDREIREHLKPNPQCSNRREHALAGRLHLCLIENMIQRQDSSVVGVVYSWEPLHPSSPLENSVARRLLLCAARFFQSIRQFRTAPDSLGQCLELEGTSKRLLIVSRLGDVLGELRDYDRAAVMLESEVDNLVTRGRLWRRVRLSMVEAALGRGFGSLDAAEDWLDELIARDLPVADITDQLLHVRTLMARARIPHYRSNHEEALQRWQTALQSTRPFLSFKDGHGFTSAIIHLSIAHAQIHIGNQRGARRSWQAATDICRTEKPDYWIPVVATTWLSNMANDLLRLQGWSVSVLGLDGHHVNVS